VEKHSQCLPKIKSSARINLWRALKKWQDGDKQFVLRDLPPRLIHGVTERGREIEAMRVTKGQIRADTDALFRELDEWQQGRRVLGRPVDRARSRSPRRQELIEDNAPDVPGPALQLWRAAR
jgi:hypothetical protein